MANEKTLPAFEPARPVFSTWIGIVLLFALFGLIALVMLAASPRGDHYEKMRAKARLEKFKVAREESDKALTTYGWIDKAKGTVRIPINDAKHLVVVDRAHKSPMIAGPIATPVPVAAPANAPATASAAPSPSPAMSEPPKPTSVSGPKSEMRGQPDAAANPAPVSPGTQPGASATPAASPPSGAGLPGSVVPSPTPSAPGTPLPVPGKT